MPIRSTPSHLSKRGNRCAVSPGLGPPAPGLPMDGTVPWTLAAFTQHHERQVHPRRVTLCSLDRRAPLPCMPLLPPRTLGRGSGVGPSGIRLLTPRQVCVHTRVHSWLGDGLLERGLNFRALPNRSHSGQTFRAPTSKASSTKAANPDDIQCP